MDNILKDFWASDLKYSIIELPTDSPLPKCPVDVGFKRESHHICHMIPRFRSSAVTHSIGVDPFDQIVDLEPMSFDKQISNLLINVGELRPVVPVSGFKQNSTKLASQVAWFEMRLISKVQHQFSKPAGCIVTHDNFGIGRFVTVALGKCWHLEAD